jgi:hypothetical protein
MKAINPTLPLHSNLGPIVGEHVIKKTCLHNFFSDGILKMLLGDDFIQKI